jgi:hypothetical protein
MEALRITLHWTSERLGISELDLVELLQYHYGLGMGPEYAQLQTILWDLESVCRTCRFGEPFLREYAHSIGPIEELMITLESW